MDWHEEFRAYARAFGKDEVAAILLRNEEREWLVWPEQIVEGLTFTLTADAILDNVDADNLQHVVGWVHSHPMGLSPEPSGTDDKQIRELARDFKGEIAEMVIFGGLDYCRVSTTQAVEVAGMVFLSDTYTTVKRERTAWDETAAKFYEDSLPRAIVENLAMPVFARAQDAEWEEMRGAFDSRYYPPSGQDPHQCPWCLDSVESEGALCTSCDHDAWDMEIAKLDSTG